MVFTNPAAIVATLKGQDLLRDSRLMQFWSVGCDDNASCYAAARNHEGSNRGGDIAPREVCEHGNL